MHNQIIRELYHCMLREENTKEKFSDKTMEAVREILEGLDHGDKEKIRDKLYLTASSAEENGFVQGFTAAFRLLTECFTK